MPPTAVAVEKYIVGTPDVSYRATGVLTAWTSVGLTMDDVLFRITQTMDNPSAALNSVDGPLRGLDYRKGGPAQAEFTLPELSSSKLAIAIPGSVTTVGTVTVTGAPVYIATTLAAASLIGDTNVKVTAVTGAAVGQYIRIDVTAGQLAEYRRITFVGTAGAGGTGIGFSDPLLRAHSNGVSVTQTDGDGRDTITASPIRRQPMTAYQDWRLSYQAPNGYTHLELYRAIATSDSVELSGTDDLSKPSGYRVVIESRLDETNLLLPTWAIIPAAP